MSLEYFIFKLLIVVLIGFMIGVERQVTGHNIGLKPTVLIAIGTFAFVSLENLIGINDTRMAANIITGIGFLCSGVIFKNGFTVNGLNTSATLWCTAGVSVLVGYGFITYSIMITSILILFNLMLPFIGKCVKPIKCFVDYSNEDVFFINVVCLKSDVGMVKNIISENSNEKISVESIQVNCITEDKFRIKAKILSNCNHLKEISKIADNIFDKNVLSVSWEKDNE